MLSQICMMRRDYSFSPMMLLCLRGLTAWFGIWLQADLDSLTIWPKLPLLSISPWGLEVPHIDSGEQNGFPWLLSCRECGCSSIRWFPNGQGSALKNPLGQTCLCAPQSATRGRGFSKQVPVQRWASLCLGKRFPQEIIIKSSILFIIWE